MQTDEYWEALSLKIDRWLADDWHAQHCGCAGWPEDCEVFAGPMNWEWSAAEVMRALKASGWVVFTPEELTRFRMDALYQGTKIGAEAARERVREAYEDGRTDQENIIRVAGPVERRKKRAIPGNSQNPERSEA